MLFNSIHFIVFLPIVHFLYWVILKDKLKLQNLLLLISSYYFYVCWNWRFLSLLISSTLLGYCAGLVINRSKEPITKKIWLTSTLIINLAILGIFKYYNFFIESAADFLSIFGFQVNPWNLQLVLPLGISFYTFHGLSYVIDIYKQKVEPERNLINYSVFVSFFPLLVAGPIERANHLLSQIKIRKFFNYTTSIDGFKQILWGFFKKIVIADQCATYVNIVFDNPTEFTASTLFLGAILFSFQIYADFSGYSDIALGTARLFGIELLRNFDYPYFSKSISEFWRRWHISLTSWFKDYLYIPMGGSRKGKMITIRNVLIVFLISGFWHGANWTFIVWGLLHALTMIPGILTKNTRLDTFVGNKNVVSNTRDLASMFITFIIVTLLWVIFRSSNLRESMEYLEALFSLTLFTVPSKVPTILILLILVLVIAEWLNRSQKYALANLENKLPRLLRWLIYYILIFIICWYSGTEQEFIYFQF